MNRAALLFMLPALTCAQDTLPRAVGLFSKNCAGGYCHGPNGGSGGGAPRLAARGFSEEYISQTVRWGLPGTAMPAFGTVLPRSEVALLVSYVASLNGIAPPRNPTPEAAPEKEMPPEVMRGRELFFDAVRGYARCATCHQVDGFGIPAVPSITKVPADVSELRRLATPDVTTATVAGESFPALVASQGSKRTKLYDLTSPPPVLKTFSPSVVTVKEGSEWRHESTLAAYTDAELQVILMFLRFAIHS